MSWRKLLYLTAFVLVLVSAGNLSGVCRADWPDNVGLLFGSQGIEPGDPSQGEAPPGKTNWYVDADAPGGGDGSYANPYNSFEQVCGYLSGDSYVTGQIRGGDYLYVKGTFSASNHVEGSNNMDIHIGRGIQAGTAAEPTVIKSWLGSPRAVFDGEYIKNSLIQFRSTTTAGHFVIQNVEVKRAAGRGISVIENVAGCEVISVVIRDGHGDGIMGTGGGILFRLNEGQPHYIMRNSLVYNNDVNPEGGTNNRGGIAILSEGGVQTGASIDIYDNEIYDEIHAIRHKHSGNVIFNAYHNIIHDSMSAFYVRIYNENNIHHNIIYDMSGTVFQLVAENQQGDRRSYIYNNTVYQAPALLSTGRDDAPDWRRIVDLRDNIYYDTITTGTSNAVIILGRWSMDDFDLSDWTSTNNDYYYLAGRTPFLIHHNDFISWEDAGAYLNDPVMYDFDPQFVDGPNHDFHLQSTSPAIGAASDNGDLGALGEGGTPQPPGQASNPSPADSATDVSVDTDLSWNSGSGATSSDVYFGTDSTPDSGEFQGNQTATTFEPGTMSNNTTYYWRIDEVNAQGTTTGNVWSFTTEAAPTPPGQASNPDPADSATDVSVAADLSWTAGSGATSHDVYFGTSSPGSFQGNQTATTFDTGTMDYDTTYYWRIDEINAAGTTTGNVWSFTTTATAPTSECDNWQTLHPEWIFCDDFETEQDLSVNYNDRSENGMSVTTNDPFDGTYSLEQEYYIGQVDAGWITKFIGDNPHLGSPGAKLDEIYYRFYHKFEDGFTGLPPKVAQTKIFMTPSDWTGGLAVYQWIGGNDLLVADIKTYDGSEYIWLPVTNSTLDFSDPANIGTWICIEVRVELNTVGQSDGQVQYWADGEQILYATDLNLQAENSNGKGLNMVMWNCYWNAGSPAVQSRFYDNLVISTAPIGQWTPGPSLPGQASNPSPADSAADVSITADLSWTAGTGSTSSDVYFGTTSPGTFQGDQTATTFDPGALANDTTYYWRIDEINAQGTTTGNVWSFITIVGAPAQATNPGPADSAANVSITEDLSWSAGSGATSHDVYFGTSSPGSFQGNQTATTFDTGTMSNDTTYYWRIDEINAGGTTTGSVWNFTTIVAAPSQATNPGPANSAANVAVDTDLSWTAGSGATSHDVYFGTSSPGSFQGNQTATTFDTGTMSNSTTYYWRIDEVNAGGTTAGNVWSFTTIVAAPSQATNPSPADSAANVSITEDLSWTAGAGATSHDIYFGTSSPGTFQGNQTATTFDTGAMSNDTTYYWRIDEVNAGGTTAGTAWSFTTIVAAPSQATNPSPADSAANVSITEDLSWTAGAGATSHDVYFGTSSPGTFQGNQTATTFDTGAMSNDTTYYWRIDEVNAGGTTAGSVWSFTTIVEAPSQASNPSPADSAADISINADLSWTAGSGATSHDVYFGTSSPGAFQGNQTSATFDTGTMSNDTTYYWRIDEVNASGTTTGAIWSFTTIVEAPSQASNPSPADSAADISINANLSWTAGSGATSHDVYFGTSSPGSFQGNQTATTYDPGTMAESTTYYWRIDQVNAGGTTTGNVWNFTTIVSTGDQIIGWWELDEGSGTTAADSSTYGNDGTILGSLAWTDDAERGWCLDFPGNTTDYVTIPNESDYDITGNMTVMAWMKAAYVDWRNFSTIIAKGRDGQGGWALQKASRANAMSFWIDVTGMPWDGIKAGVGVFDGQWHHVAGVYDGSNAYIYIDGGLDSNSVTCSGSITTNDWDVYIGLSSAGMDRSWEDLIDDVRVYNYALTQSDINDIYTGGPTPPAQASNPSPGNGATDVSVSADLSWTAGSGATSHDVYFGTTSPGAFQGNQAETTFEPGILSYDITYYWRIDEINTAGTTTGAVWSFTTEAAPQPPGQASNPDPADSAADVSINADLSWTAGSGSTSSDVYFGTTSPGTFQGNQAANTFDPGTMANDTTYYWRIDEINAVGTTTGTVWSFTTIVAPPSQASNPDPADSAANVDIDADLSWTAGTGSTSSDVYFGTTSPGLFQGNQTATTFEPGTMANDTTYYWRIDEINIAGTTTGTVWSFTTIVAPPTQATNPDPADSAVDISKTADLSWTAGSGATSHDVYFGTTSPGSFQGNQAETTFDPGTMANDTIYYWRIDEINAGGTTTGIVWIFTTVAGAGDQIIGWWELDDGSETTAADSSTYGNDGTLVGNVAWTDDAERGWCLDFPGNTTDYVTIPNESDYDLTGNMTVMAWMKASYVDWRNFSTIIGKGQDPTGWALQKAGRDNAMGFYVGVSGMPWDGIKAGVGIFDNQWHHVAGVYDGSNAYIYIDGGLDSNSVPCSGSITTNDYDVYMGINSQSMGRSWEGLVDDIRVYNYALTQSDINDIYSGGPTPPGQASNPSPADSATDVSVDADLSWTAGSGSTSSDVYFGITSPGSFQGNQTATTFDPGTMAYDTAYYWRIDEINAAGTTTGAVWGFTTEQELLPPGQATNPSPADSATDVDIDADLSWTAGTGSTSSDVYFGTTSPGAFQGNQTASTFDPGTMANGTTYYWRIDEVNTGGTTTGNVWNFTTVAAPEWTELTYDDFESGWGSYTDGGGDCSLYTYGTYAHQGSNAADIQDNSGVSSSFYYTNGINVDTPGYTQLKVEFWYIPISMDNSKEDFWLQYYDGTNWHTVETWARGIDFENGNPYNPTVYIDESSYTFPTNMQIRFMCDASNNQDDVYIDEIRVSAK